MFQKVFLALLWCHTCQHFIKDVKVSFSNVLMNEPDFFQEVGINCSTNEGSTLLELQFNEFSESRGIVISDGPCVSKGFQDGVGFENCET